MTTLSIITLDLFNATVDNVKASVPPSNVKATAVWVGQDDSINQMPMTTVDNRTDRVNHRIRSLGHGGPKALAVINF